LDVIVISGKVKVSKEAKEAILHACQDFDDDENKKKEKLKKKIARQQRVEREAANAAFASKSTSAAVAWGANKKKKKGISIEKTLAKMESQPSLWSGGEVNVKNMLKKQTGHEENEHQEAVESVGSIAAQDVAFSRLQQAREKHPQKLPKAKAAW
jgi:hypothetical protein